jgi:hypothetical protein
MIEMEFSMVKGKVRVILTTNLDVKMCVPKWSQKIRQFLATKQTSTLQHAPYLPDFLPLTFSFPKIEIFTQRNQFLVL